MVHEIFTSVSGECGVIRQGDWVTFVRLAGCNLRCFWCDTSKSHSKTAGAPMTITDILSTVILNDIYKVVLTGGEPLLQGELVYDLLRALVQRGIVVQVETNGTIFPPEIPGVTWIVDYKLPSSRMEDRMIPVSDFMRLPMGSWIKFVIGSPVDYYKAMLLCREIRKFSDGKYHLAFSACPPDMKHADLYEHMLMDGLTDITFSAQIHKLCGLVENSSSIPVVK